MKSIYGEIDADVYIRRFFDMEFKLPEPNAEKFCKKLIIEYELNTFFLDMNKFYNNNNHKDDFESIDNYFPLLCSHMNLSLRDIKHCMMSIVFASKNIENHRNMVPLILSTLVVLRLKNNSLYQDFISGKMSS